MHIPLFLGEFGFELSIHIPFVNYLYENNALNSCHVMISMVDWYTFLPSNVIVICEDKTRSQILTRLSQYPAVVCSYKFAKRILSPEMSAHQKLYDTELYKPPVLKGRYSHLVLDFTERPLLIIHNKYSIEWDKQPINFINVSCLKQLVQTFHEKYCIVYIHPTNNTDGYVKDNQSLLEFNVPEDLWGHGFTIQKLMKQYDLSYNTLQLALHDKCTNFISVQGGSSRIASYFQGTNIILHKQGSELQAKSYEGYFEKLSHAKIYVVENENELLLVSQLVY
jgi:hypothetical protein